MNLLGHALGQACTTLCKQCCSSRPAALSPQCLRIMLRALSPLPRLVRSFLQLGVEETRVLASLPTTDLTARQGGRPIEDFTAHSWGQLQTRSASATAVDTITVTFFDEKDGSEKSVQVPLGENLLEAAHNNEIDLEGACEGSLACSTCHVIVQDPELYARIPEAEDDENDMLDLAYGLTETSRLGCQVIATQELDGLKVRIPSATRNFAVDGYVPKPH